MNRMTSILAGSLVSLISGSVSAGAFIFANGDEANRIAHPSSYFGTGGEITVSVCIAPTSESIDDMLVSVQNTIDVWNAREPVSPNVLLGGSNDIPFDQIDFESTLLHEVGHCLGLAHPNLATESGLPGADRNYTKADQGTNEVFDIDPGLDGIKGSADDLRGDDINLHWFNIGLNNPFVLTTPIDASNYSRDLADLPPGDNFAANADRSVGSALGFANSEAVMQQGAFFDEDQRQLGVDDVATLGLGMAGIDRTAGNSDDYIPVLEYGGVASGCDITIEVTGTSFAFCSVGGSFISPDHLRITNASVQLGSASEIDWFFNQVSLNPDEVFEDRFEL